MLFCLLTIVYAHKQNIRIGSAQSIGISFRSSLF